MWSIPKICIMLYVYCQFICDKPASSQALASSSGYFSEKVKPIEEATIAELSAEKLLLSTFAIFPAEMCNHYRNADTDTGLQPTYESVDLFAAQSNMLIACGKCMVEVGEALAHHTVFRRFHDVAGITREEVIGKVMKDRLARIEAAFRRFHETAGTFRYTQMPPAMYQLEGMM